MDRAPANPEVEIRDASVATPLDGYELIDFGHGRKLPLKVSDIYRRSTS